MATASWIDRLRSRISRDEAQTMAEYAVILGVITPAVIVAFALLSDSVESMIRSVIGAL
jgi:Flp pilus assembly pilin Flp